MADPALLKIIHQVFNNLMHLLWPRAGLPRGQIWSHEMYELVNLDRLGVIIVTTGFESLFAVADHGMSSKR
jgi:hypothetical protein